MLTFVVQSTRNTQPHTPTTQMAKITETSIESLIPDDRNFNKGTEYGSHLMDESVRKFGLGRSILIDKNNRIIAGNKTHEKAGELGFDKVLVVETDGNTLVAVKRKDIDLDSREGRELALADNATNKANLAWDEDIIAQVTQDWDINPEGWGIHLEEFDIKPEEGEDQTDRGGGGSLSARFLVPPFSVLDSRKGYWGKRKQYWISMGINSSEGREEALTYRKLDEKRYRSAKSFNKLATSVFDPVLCEVVYRWFNVEAGKILDPFAGGSVRGIVASRLGCPYHGNDLRQEQITENVKQAEEILRSEDIFPQWTVGDSREIDSIVTERGFDLLFSCPPYADLEKYSDLDEDLSNMDYNDFITAYRLIIHKSCGMLKPDRFAVFVVGYIRDKKGAYRNFVSDTIQAFLDAGLVLYNEMILVTQVASLAIRAANFINATRKVGKHHQNVLVFYKGDIGKIKDNYKELDLSYLQEVLDDEDAEE